jgi:hypothetical protein
LLIKDQERKNKFTLFIDNQEDILHRNHQQEIKNCSKTSTNERLLNAIKKKVGSQNIALVVLVRAVPHLNR